MSEGKLTVQLFTSNTEPLQIDVVNPLGQVIRRRTYAITSGQNKIELDLQDLSNNNDSFIDPFCIDKLCDIEPQQCIYKKHNVLY